MLSDNRDSGGNSVNDRGKEKVKKTLPPGKSFITYILLGVLLILLFHKNLDFGSTVSITYSDFKTFLAKDQVVECLLGFDSITGKIDPKRPSSSDNNSATNTVFKPVDKSLPDKEFQFSTVRIDDAQLAEQLEKSSARFTGSNPSFLEQFLLTWVLPIGIMIALWVFISRRLGMGGQSILSIGKSRAKLSADKETGVTFEDVAGCDESKYELQEVVDFLKNPARYKALGAQIPKGILLVGPPGTGKTLLAKAVAGEAKVAFFSLSGSDFVEMFVGVGAARVRDLFKQAKEESPCIIFIDELDAIGRQRGVHMGAVNDEREQTLNQLLVEMDGFETNGGIIILAATNRPDVLDKALLRPGRFDRQVIVDSPDLDGREAILKVHSRTKPLATEVNLRKVAQSTPGFSGADLANMLNEAALLAARRLSSVITQKDLEEAIEKVIAGTERRSRKLREKELQRVAIHEAGHALVAAFLPNSDPVQKISIVPRGRSALGYTMQVPPEDQFILTQKELLARMSGLLGGRAAEEVVFEEISTGAENDLKRATALSRQMVCMYGMTKSIGLTHCLEPNQSLFMGGEMGLRTDCSADTQKKIDAEVSKLLNKAYNVSLKLLTKYRDKLDIVTTELRKKETLDSEEFYKLIGLEIPQPPQATKEEPSNLPPLPTIPTESAKVADETTEAKDA